LPEWRLAQDLALLTQDDPKIALAKDLIRRVPQTKPVVVQKQYLAVAANRAVSLDVPRSFVSHDAYFGVG
jgi:hypothetical protein